MGGMRDEEDESLVLYTCPVRCGTIGQWSLEAHQKMKTRQHDIMKHDMMMVCTVLHLDGHFSDF